MTASIELVPNPTAGKIRITVKESGLTINEHRLTNVEVFDIYGQRLKGQSGGQSGGQSDLATRSGLTTNASIALDLTNLPAGVYTLVVKGDGFRVVEKVVKM